LLREPRFLGKLLLREPTQLPRPAHIFPNQNAHIHARQNSGLHHLSLSTPVCIEKSAAKWVLFGHPRLSRRLHFGSGIAFFEQLEESDSGGAEWYVGSDYPGGLRQMAPNGEVVTDYDRAHLQHYVRLLDARRSGVTADDMCRLILEIDPVSDPHEAQRILQSHLDRAVWMSSVGFRQL
jgi:hypothetical protein